MNTIAVVVTYNRKELLCECLDAILAQTRPVQKIVVMDNASTDGTRELLLERGFLSNSLVEYHSLEKNIGGSGGFNEGMKIAAVQKSDWVWIMDDDTIPHKDAHEGAMRAAERVCLDEADRPVSFLASCVYGPNGEFLNTPKPDVDGSVEKDVRGWYKYLDKGMLRIARATFVSIFVSKRAIQKCGYPLYDYFIWGDDMEYTMRLSRYCGPAYMVGASKVMHKCKIYAHSQLVEMEAENRIRMYFYSARNDLITTRFYRGNRQFLRQVVQDGKRALRMVFYKKGLLKARVHFKGIIASFVQYARFRNEIEGGLSSGI